MYTPTAKQIRELRQNKLTLIFFCGTVSSKALLQRPIAGAQVPVCRLEKKMADSWSHIEPGTFRVRGENYFR